MKTTEKEQINTIEMVRKIRDVQSQKYYHNAEALLKDLAKYQTKQKAA